MLMPLMFVLRLVFSFELSCSGDGIAWHDPINLRTSSSSSGRNNFCGNLRLSRLRSWNIKVNQNERKAQRETQIVRSAESYEIFNIKCCHSISIFLPFHVRLPRSLHLFSAICICHFYCLGAKAGVSFYVQVRLKTFAFCQTHFHKSNIYPMLWFMHRKRLKKFHTKLLHLALKRPFKYRTLQ